MNHIQIYDNILSKDVCDNIIEYFDNSSWKEKGLTAGGHRPDLKNGTNLNVSLNDCSKFMYDQLVSDILPSLNIGMEKYKKRFPFLEEVSYWTMDNKFNIQRFAGEEEGYFVRHCERGNADPRSNNRMLVWMIYLNNAKSGTRFYYPTRDVKAKQGRLVIWPADWTYPHSGIIPNRGEKYLMTGWYSYKEREKERE